MKVVAIIQARVGSTRLPGKILRSLAGQTILGHIIHRVRSARQLDGIWVATTESARDEAVMAECARQGVPGFRGSEEDVLARYHAAAQAAKADAIVRITSDCPLFDPILLDEQVRIFRTENAQKATVDYLSNCTLKRTFPRGLDTEIFTFAALEKAHREARHSYEREHVTPYLYRHPELFRLRSFEGREDLSSYRWTLDTPEDWEFIAAVYQELYRENRLFSWEDVLQRLRERPELALINAHVEQKQAA